MAKQRVGAWARALALAVAPAVLGSNLVVGDEAVLGEDASALAAPRKTWAESLENLGRLHYDNDHPWLQELWLVGRYHGQYHWAEGSAGEDEGWEDRRFRVGAQARLFRKLSLQGQMLSGPDFDPFYAGFTELWAQWAFNEAVALTVGQQKHRFTHNRTVSSRYINTIERTLFVNMVNAEYTPAVTWSGRYQVDWSDGASGLVAQRRYERPAGLTTGDLYQAGYLGLNYYLAAHRVKLVLGAEYSTLGGEDLWTLSAGVRVFWGPHTRGPFPMAQVLKAR